LRHLYKIIGSADIFGNPVGLFSNIGTGFVEFIESPIEGMEKGGPLEAGRGLIKGTGSLMKNTISGFSNSLSKISGSFAGGISNLTFDDEYKLKRM